MDFPYLYYRFACGEQIAPNTRYREGITSRHLLGDLRNLVWVLFQNDPMRALTFPGRLRAIKDFLVLPRSSKFTIVPGRK